MQLLLILCLLLLVNLHLRGSQGHLLNKVKVGVTAEKKCCDELEWPMQTYATELSGSMQCSTHLQVPARQHAFMCDSSADILADAYR